MAWKGEVRVAGFDDAPHARGDAAVPVVGVVMRGGLYVEAVLRTSVAGDGDDATARIAESVNGYRGKDGLAAVLLQNLMVGGFNTVDLPDLHAATGVPVVAVARGQPDLPAVRRALTEGSIPGGLAKWARIEKVLPLMRSLQGGKLTVTPVGMDGSDAEALLTLTTVRGLLPEPLRLAHLIGAGWVLGQSKGQ